MSDKEQSNNGKLKPFKPSTELIRRGIELELIESGATPVEACHIAALHLISNSFCTLTSWFTTGGLTEILTGTAKAKGVSDMLAALLQHDGRNALDARHVEQNAIEITHHLEAVFDKLVSHLKDKNEGKLDPDLHNAEEEFRKFKDVNKA